MSRRSSMNSSKFRYSLDNPFLTQEQRLHYEKNGFLVVRNLVKADDIATYRSRFIDICHNRVDVGRMTVMKDVALRHRTDIDPELVVNKVQDYQQDPVLSSYFRLPEVLRYVECFVGQDIDAVNTMLINKPPDSGKLTSRHPFHQDQYYFPFGPPDRIVCSWTAMQRVTRDNGCLVVVPGSHTGELLEHGYPEWEGNVNKMYHGILDLDLDSCEKVYLEMEEGDTVFFHPLLIHGSGSNQTTGFRKAISCHFSTTHKTYIDVTNTIQEPIAKEVEDLAKKWYPDAYISFIDTWMLKSLTVQQTQFQSKM